MHRFSLNSTFYNNFYHFTTFPMLFLSKISRTLSKVKDISHKLNNSANSLTFGTGKMSKGQACHINTNYKLGSICGFLPVRKNGPMKKKMYWNAIEPLKYSGKRSLRFGATCWGITTHEASWAGGRPCNISILIIISNLNSKKYHGLYI